MTPDGSAVLALLQMLGLGLMCGAAVRLTR